MFSGPGCPGISLRHPLRWATLSAPSSRRPPGSGPVQHPEAPAFFIRLAIFTWSLMRDRRRPSAMPRALAASLSLARRCHLPLLVHHPRRHAAAVQRDCPRGLPWVDCGRSIATLSCGAIMSRRAHRRGICSGRILGQASLAVNADGRTCLMVPASRPEPDGHQGDGDHPQKQETQDQDRHEGDCHFLALAAQDLNQSQGEMRRWWGSNDGAGAFSKDG